MRAIETLAQVTIAAEDPAAVAADYTHLLDCAPELLHDRAERTVHVFRTRNIRLLIRGLAANETPGLCGITFRVDDVARVRETLARCGLPVADDGDTGARLDRTATHGVPLFLTGHDLVASTGSTGAVGLDHVVIRTPNPERAVALYGGRLGLDMRLDRSNPAWNARLLFFRCGDLVVEIAHVLSDGVSDEPDSFGGLSWCVPDIDAIHERLSRDGFDLSPVRTGRRPASRVCTVRNRTAGVPTILLGVTPRDG